jgi:hypothetical protein
MALLSFWKSNRDEVLKLTIEQIVSNAGDGNLRDSSSCSQELWAAAGFKDTELGVLMEPEVDHGTAKVYTGV